MFRCLGRWETASLMRPNIFPAGYEFETGGSTIS
jgi:hypothetical protein